MLDTAGVLLPPIGSVEARMLTRTTAMNAIIFHHLYGWLRDIGITPPQRMMFKMTDWSLSSTMNIPTLLSNMSEREKVS